MRFIKRFWQAIVLTGAFAVFLYCVGVINISFFEYVVIAMFILNIAVEFFCVQE